jgi:hypothetical protein
LNYNIKLPSQLVVPHCIAIVVHPYFASNYNIEFPLLLIVSHRIAILVEFPLLLIAP